MVDCAITNVITTDRNINVKVVKVDLTYFCRCPHKTLGGIPRSVFVTQASKM